MSNGAHDEKSGLGQRISESLSHGECHGMGMSLFVCTASSLVPLIICARLSLSEMLEQHTHNAQQDNASGEQA